MAKEEVDLTAYLTKAPTSLQERYADWLLDETIVGYDPSKAKTKEEAFREGVRLATAMRMIFQASPENKAANDQRASADPAPVKKAAAAKATPAKKTTGKKAAPAPAEEEEPPAKTRPVAKKGAPKKGAARRVADETDEAPF